MRRVPTTPQVHVTPIPSPTSDEPEKKGFWSGIRRIFLQGLVITIPLYITIWIFKLFLSSLDGFLAPVFRKYLGHHIWGLGVLSALIVVFLIGLVTRNLVGRMVLTGVESLLGSIPVVKNVYHAAKELMDAFSGANKARIFRQVLLVEYPRLGMYSIGFVTNEVEFTRGDRPNEGLLNVYIPHPPNPTSGMLILLPLDQVHPLDVTVEEGLKLVLSGGIVSPEQLKERLKSVATPASDTADPGLRST